MITEAQKLAFDFPNYEDGSVVVLCHTGKAGARMAYRVKPRFCEADRLEIETEVRLGFAKKWAELNGPVSPESIKAAEAAFDWTDFSDRFKKAWDEALNL